MKTTIELPDDLLLEAKKHAVELRTTLRALVESGLRRELGLQAEKSRRAAIRWVTVKGGLPKGWDISDRSKMMEHLQRDRT